MRAVLLILILAVVAIIVLVATGLIDINQIRGAKAPDIDASQQRSDRHGRPGAGVRRRDRVGSVGTRDANVKVPALDGEPGRQRCRAGPEPGTGDPSTACS